MYLLDWWDALLDQAVLQLLNRGWVLELFPLHQKKRYVYVRVSTTELDYGEEWAAWVVVKYWYSFGSFSRGEASI
jgi:hypothetical protein